MKYFLKTTHFDNAASLLPIEMSVSSKPAKAKYLPHLSYLTGFFLTKTRQTNIFPSWYSIDGCKQYIVTLRLQDLLCKAWTFF